MKLPMNMREVNLFVEGVGHLGTSKELVLPKIERETESKKKGGFTRQVDTGIFKELEAEFTLEEYSKLIYEALLKAVSCGGKGAFITAKGSIYQDGCAIPVVATFRGGMDVDNGKWGAGEAIESKQTIRPTAYSLEIDGKEYVNIDMDIPQAIINGTDVLAELRSHIK